jgi:hypothetical protein
MKARIVEPEETAADRQQLSKQKSAHTTIDELLEAMILDGLTPGSIMRTNGGGGGFSSKDARVLERSNIWSRVPTGTEIKTYCAGEDQQQFSKPTKLASCGHEGLADSCQSVRT